MRLNTRHLVLVGAALVGAATAATSAISLYGIAVKCGIPEPWAAANPIALDAGAAISALAWITQAGERRTWGRRTAVAALVASLVENGLDHALGSGLLVVTLWLVLAVSACIPGMLFATVHLAALMARQAPPEPPTVAEFPSPAPSGPAPELVEEETPPTEEMPRVAQLVALRKPSPDQRAAELVAAGCGRKRLARELGVSEYDARRIIDTHRKLVRA